MRNPSKFIKSFTKKFKKFKLTPLEMEKFTELVRILSNQETYKLKSFELSPEVLEKRLKICQACEHITTDPEEYSSTEPHCSLCHCNLNLKVTKNYEQCPLRKWVTDDAAMKHDIHQAIEIINEKMIDEKWINLLSVEEQFEVNYQEAIEKLEKDSSTDLVDELIAQSESEEEIEDE